VHVLPQLRELDSRYGEQLAIVGVHSGKYTAERETSRIRDASIRLDAVHPTINDRQFRIWRAYAVRAWPTLVAIDPRGYVVGMQAGEFTADALSPFVDRVLAGARDADPPRGRSVATVPGSPTLAPGDLAYPGNVAIDGRCIAIADSAHHRVLVGTLDDAGTTMHVDHTVGGPTPGYRDGHEPLFTNPQGLVFRGAELFVADAGNHVIRRLSLATGACDTLAGTGRQLRGAVDEAKGALSSPWDLAVDGDTLYVAMAGVHQLWTVSLSSGQSAVLSGSGAEELHDASHDAAALAQPMGLCVDGDTLWFVDAESSAVRRASTDPGEAVRTIVGTGLFDFGDVDGTGDDVRLQHPQGIARAADGRLLVCDSYNDALKWVDPLTRRVSTWVRGLHEPAGLALGSHHAYVADTNAHRIACVARESGEVTGLAIRN
jgi:hypothetical protein